MYCQWNLICYEYGKYKGSAGDWTHITRRRNCMRTYNLCQRMMRIYLNRNVKKNSLDQDVLSDVRGCSPNLLVTSFQNRGNKALKRINSNNIYLVIFGITREKCDWYPIKDEAHDPWERFLGCSALLMVPFLFVTTRLKAAYRLLFPSVDTDLPHTHTHRRTDTAFYLYWCMGNFRE